MVESSLLIISGTCMSSLDALMFYERAQNDFFKGNYMHDQYKHALKHETLPRGFQYSYRKKLNHLLM